MLPLSPEEYHNVVEQLMTAITAAAESSLTWLYKQGMIDCAQLLKELKIK